MRVSGRIVSMIRHAPGEILRLADVLLLFRGLASRPRGASASSMRSNVFLILAVPALQALIVMLVR